MPSEDLGDSKLLQELSFDLQKNFSKLMNAYRGELYSYLIEQVESVQNAEDILQNSWMRVYKALSRYPEDRIRSLKLRSWLYKVARNEMCTFMRKKNSSKTVSIDDVTENAKECVALVSLDPEVYPEACIELKSQREEVREMIRHLSPACRDVLTLYCRDLSYQEIAEVIGKPVETVRTYASRGLSILRERFAAHVN